MKIEVELKAHVEDPEGLKALLEIRFEPAGGYFKEDLYFRLPAGAPEGARTGQKLVEPVEFRLRRENGEVVVTFKRKSVTAGVEVNEETEFSVDDPRAFEGFAAYLGAEVFSRKRKEGSRFRAGGVTIELSKVARLGWFVEIEELVEDGDPAAVDAARRRVRALLSSLGIEEDRIEPRYYTDMLAELDR